MMGFEAAYGYRPNGSVGEEGQITCNYPGAAYHLSGARRLDPMAWVVLAVVMCGFSLLA